MVFPLAAWSNRVVCGTKHRLLPLSPLQTFKVTLPTAHTTQAAQHQPQGEGSQVDPQRRPITWQSWDKETRTRIWLAAICKVPQQCSLLLGTHGACVKTLLREDLASTLQVGCSMQYPSLWLPLYFQQEGNHFESITRTLMCITQDSRYRHKENSHLNSSHPAQ